MKLAVVLLSILTAILFLHAHAKTGLIGARFGLAKDLVNSKT